MTTTEPQTLRHRLPRLRRLVLALTALMGILVAVPAIQEMTGKDSLYQVTRNADGALTVAVDSHQLAGRLIDVIPGWKPVVLGIASWQWHVPATSLHVPWFGLSLVVTFLLLWWYWPRRPAPKAAHQARHRFGQPRPDPYVEYVASLRAYVAQDFPEDSRWQRAFIAS